MQLHLDLPPKAASQDLRALWSHLYQLTERLNTTVFADQPAVTATQPEAIPAEEAPAIPTDHASPDPTYGPGSQSEYGHVKLSDTASTSLNAAGGTAATPKAVAAVQQALDARSDLICGQATIAYGPKSTSLTVSFGVTFTSPPTVMVSQVFDNANLSVPVARVTTTAYTVTLPAGVFTTSGTRAFQWLAVGKIVQT